MHWFSGRLDLGKAICSIFHRYSNDDENNKACYWASKLLCCQSDPYSFAKNPYAGCGRTITTCFIQTFYVMFIFPLCIKQSEQVPVLSEQ